ncbi:putative membrane protein [Rhodopirellula maiorica SM1]|uniref:Putative membrane protein n=1 Tax=Rhodopirellula maiorica SM1 TaxID=1265738 RepID=M5RTU2_9BACT|nr:putative membrane protein [Rhodopirellula maiorica SM1]
MLSHEHEREPELGRAAKDGLRGSTNEKSIVRPPVMSAVMWSEYLSQLFDRDESVRTTHVDYMNADKKSPNDAVVGGETADLQSKPSADFVKYAAHASWLAPVVASLLERRFSSVAADSSVYGFFATLTVVLVVVLIAFSGLCLGAYAIVRSKKYVGVRKPATIGVIISAGFLALSIGGFAHGFKHAKAIPELTNSDAAQEMKLFASEAVETALDNFDIKLDFSPESIEHVETILGRLHDQHAQIPFDDDRLTIEALKWGGYIGEVVRALRDCNWAFESSINSEIFPVVYDNGSESYPVRWCYERIVHGKEFDVRHKFEVLVADRHDADSLSSPTANFDPLPQLNSPIHIATGCTSGRELMFLKWRVVHAVPAEPWRSSTDRLSRGKGIAKKP